MADLQEGRSWEIYGDLLVCRCENCSHRSRAACVRDKCYCRDLEDAFSLITRHDAGEELA